MARQALLDAPERPAEDVGIATYESLHESDRRLVLTILVAASVALVLGGGAAVAWARLHMPHAAPEPVVSTALPTVDPPTGTTGLRPDAKITVLANRGDFASVAVTDDACHPRPRAMGPSAHS